MGTMGRIYSQSMALLTDLYQITMAYGYWKLGIGRHEAVYHLYFREQPFGGGYAVCCGLEDVVEYLRQLKFDEGDLSYLASLTGDDGKPLFDRGFLDELAGMEMACDIDAIPEGTVVFAPEPLVRVRGPILQSQLLETALLNMVGFQTLVATKAARICHAARGEPVVEFGLRRAQGIDGSLSATRAAFVGGCESTSNVLAGKLFGIPVKGTHAHSWVLSFDSELEAFEAYARMMPNNCVFLVDTFDTLEGVRHAVEIGKKLRAGGHRLAGIRLDSGDLAYLSIEARKILDGGGFADAQIVASNDLDEHLIESLKLQGSRITIWGVGTKLATAFDQPALGNIYKLSAIRENAVSPWRYKMKVSEQLTKVTYPGILQVRRFQRNGNFIADMIYSEPPGVLDPPRIIDPKDSTRRRLIHPEARGEDLLVPVMRGGKIVFTPPPLAEVRRRTIDQLGRLHPAILRLTNPHEYPVGLEQRLSELRTNTLLQAREHSGQAEVVVA
jgi:nicotinate phosphoribosyltransferase